LRETRPFQAPGIRTDPPVSDPRAAKQIPEETETADPPELPPEMTQSWFSSPDVSAMKSPEFSDGKWESLKSLKVILMLVLRVVPFITKRLFR